MSSLDTEIGRDMKVGLMCLNLGSLQIKDAASTTCSVLARELKRVAIPALQWIALATLASNPDTPRFFSKAAR